MRYKKENEKLLIIIQKEKKPCLSLMNRFNALVNVQHFDAQNCNTRKKKRKKTYSLQLFETSATLQNILKY